MSAYLCGPKMFARLARFAAPEPGRGVMPYMLEARGCASLAEGIAAADGNVALAYARLLQAANVASVAARYGADDANVDLIGAQDVEAVRAGELPAVAVLKACDCLEYQSSETDDWYTSGAKILLDAIRERAIGELPGYAEANWGYPLMPREVSEQSPAEREVCRGDDVRGASMDLVPAARELYEALERFCVAYERHTALQPAAMANAFNRARDVLARTVRT